MRKEIREVLVLLLGARGVVASWGMSNININPHSLSFNVNGLRYKGKVRIVPAPEAQYAVILRNGNKLYCTAEDMVYQLDTIIEHTESYSDDLLKWIRINTHIYP